MKYSAKFKEKMVVKMLGPNAKSANALSREVGIAQPTLSLWLRQAKMDPMTEDQRKGSPGRPKGQKRWTDAEKIRVVLEAAAAGPEGLGALLRREGLHEPTLAQFRQEVMDAAARGFEAARPARGLSPEQKELRKLKKELDRKEKALAEAAALLVLRGKAEALFRSEEEGNDTDESNGK